jgi:hypothetical protein
VRYCEKHDHLHHFALACEDPSLGGSWQALRKIADKAGASGRYALMRFGGRCGDRWRVVPVRGSDREAPAMSAFVRLRMRVRHGNVALLDPGGVLLAWYVARRPPALW